MPEFPTSLQVFKTMHSNQLYFVLIKYQLLQREVIALLLTFKEVKLDIDLHLEKIIKFESLNSLVISCYGIRTTYRSGTAIIVLANFGYVFQITVMLL